MIRSTTILRPKVARWDICFCCNCGPKGKVESIQFGIGRGDFNFGTDYLDKHDLYVNGPAITFRWIDANHFRLGRKTYRCLGMREWVGNQCWDGCFVTTQSIREISTTLKQRGWEPESGSTTLWDWWEKLQEEGTT